MREETEKSIEKVMTPSTWVGLKRGGVGKTLLEVQVNLACERCGPEEEDSKIEAFLWMR